MTDRVRDARTERRYFVDNDIVLVYGKLIGVYGGAVYNSLCVHADLKEQTCFPSHATIADEWGCGVTKVKEALGLLRDYGLITWERQERDGGGRTSNLYTLLDPPKTPSRHTTTPSSPHGDPPSRQAASNNPHKEQSPPNNVPPDGGGVSEAEPMVVDLDLDDEYYILDNTGVRKDEVIAGCTVCGMTVTQEMNLCLSCGAHVIWDHSRVWKKLYGQPATYRRKLKGKDLEPKTPLEVAAVAIFGTGGAFSNITQAKDFRRLAKKCPEGFLKDLVAWAKKNHIDFGRFQSAVQNNDNVKRWEAEEQERDDKKEDYGSDEDWDRPSLFRED